MSSPSPLLPAGQWGSSVRLPRWEVCLYVSAWTSAALYSVYSVYIASIDFKDNLNDYFLVFGWNSLDRQKDTSNFEWDFWSDWFLEVWPWFAGHLALSHVFKKAFVKGRSHIFTAYSLVALYFLLGWQPLLLFLTHVLLVYLATFTRSKVIVWGASLLLLTSLNLDVTVKIMKRTVQYDPYEKKFYLLLFTLAMFNLRYTSAALDMCARNIEITTTKREKELEKEKRTKQRQKNNDRSQDQNLTTFTLMDMLLYVFYLPLAFTGPTITFDKFHTQFHRRRPDAQLILPALWVFLKRVIRVTFWALAIEYSLHYLYFNCIQLDVPLLERLPLWALAGIGYCHGQFFMVKYVVLFGVPSALAELDGLEPPLGPKCVARIHLYSDMWKYFDRGLYVFLIKYIYIPLGGSRSGLWRQLLASALCFAFVYYWHGAEDYLLVWVVLNFIGIALETVAAQISQHESVQGAEQSWLSASWSRRLRAILSIPLLAMSVVAIFNFFGGRQVGYVFYQRLIIDGFPVSTFTVAIFLYCCIQTSMEVALWEKQKLKTL